MRVRLRRAVRTARDTYRITLDLFDPDRPDWADGDCVVRVDLRDAPTHEAVPRGPLAAAFELYRLAPDQRPETSDAQLLWDMGKAVDGYVRRVVEAGAFCPYSGSPKDEAPDRSP